MRLTALWVSSKLPRDGSHGYVFAGLRDHLETLNLGGAAVRVEHGDTQIGGVGEAGECCLAGISARGGENHDAFARLGRGAAHELGQHLQSDVFECARGAPEQLEDIIVPHGDERRNFFRGEGLSVGCVDAGLDFLGGVVVEQRAEDVGSVFSVGLGDDASENRWVCGRARRSRTGRRRARGRRAPPV